MMGEGDENRSWRASEIESRVAADMASIFSGMPNFADSHCRQDRQIDKVRSLLPNNKTKQTRWRTSTLVWSIILAGAGGGIAVWLLMQSPLSLPNWNVQNTDPVSVLPAAASKETWKSFPLKPVPVLPIAVGTAESVASDTKVHGAPMPQSRNAQKPTAFKVTGQKSVSQSKSGRTGINCAQLALSDQAWCLRPAVLAADKRLRVAYDAALNAGADPRLIARSQRQWRRVRRQTDDAPQFVIDEYNALAGELESLSIEGNPGVGR